MTAWPPRLREDLEDTSLKASVADLLDALAQARLARDRALRELANREARIEALIRHLARARERIAVPKRQRRSQNEPSPQLCLPLEDTP